MRDVSAHPRVDKVVEQALQRARGVRHGNGFSIADPQETGKAVLKGLQKSFAAEFPNPQSEIILESSEIILVILVDTQHLPVVAQFELQLVTRGIEQENAGSRERPPWKSEA